MVMEWHGSEERKGISNGDKTRTLNECVPWRVNISAASANIRYVLLIIAPPPWRIQRRKTTPEWNDKDDVQGKYFHSWHSLNSIYPDPLKLKSTQVDLISNLRGLGLWKMSIHVMR